jgi:signal transduction histidine kinase
MIGNYEEAIKTNYANLAFAEKKGNDYQKADVYKTLAMSFSMQERNDSALHYSLRALEVYEKNRDSLAMAKVMVNTAVIYSSMGDPRALVFCEKAKEIFRHRDAEAYLVTLTNLALYQAYEKQYDRSEANYKEALALASAKRNYNSLAHIYSGLIDVAYRKKDYESMLPYAVSFEDVGRSMKNEYILLRAKLAMGKALFFNNRFDEAERYFTDALKLSHQLEDNLLLKEMYGMYSYLVLSKYNDIVEFDRYRQKIDSLTSLEEKDLITRTTKELEVKYENEKKDNQLRVQSANIRQKQAWNYGLGAAVILLFIIGFVSLRSYRNRKKIFEQEKKIRLQQIEKLEKEKQLAATQAILQGQDEERGRLAKDLHDGLGGMLSGIRFSFSNLGEQLIPAAENQQAFARSMDMLDTVAKELRRVAHNMMPESLMRFGLDTAVGDMCKTVKHASGIHVRYQSIGIKELQLDRNVAISVYRIVQELLNNIMKHAKASEAIIQLGQDKGNFTITAEDNGIGFDASSIKLESMGWTYIRNRVEVLKGKLDIQSAPDKGTSVFIEFNTAS